MSATVLTDLSETARLVAARAVPATVRIGRDGRGSGVVVADGRVVTNAHNLRDRTTLVTFADGRAVQGRITGVDADGDLVVLEADTAGVAPLEWADRVPAQGDVVFAVAAAPGGGRVTFGLVTAAGRSFRGPRGRRIAGSVEHSAPLARGSSGGALVDTGGRLVGINTNRVGDGFYLALPADESLRARVARLAAGESVERPRLGVALAPAHVAARLRRAVGLSEQEGLLVRGVEGDTPASRAGLQEGDLLVAAAGRPLRIADDLFDVLDRLAADPAPTTLTLTVVRGTDPREVTVSFVPPAA